MNYTNCMGLIRLTIIFSALGLVLMFQNCQSSSTSEKVQKNQLSGNGSGYGGKLQPGKYYATDEEAQCKEPSSGELSSIVGVIEVKDDGRAFYADGCGENEDKEISSDLITQSAANKNVLGYKDKGLAFEWYDEVPLNLQPQDHIYGTCFFLVLEIKPGGIIDMNVVLRKLNSTERRVEIHYSEFSADMVREVAKSITPFNAIENENSIGSLTYTSDQRPDYLLTVEKPNFDNPVVQGKLQLTLNEQSINRESLYCVF